MSVQKHGFWGVMTGRNRPCYLSRHLARAIFSIAFPDTGWLAVQGGIVPGGRWLLRLGGPPMMGHPVNEEVTLRTSIRFTRAMFLVLRIFGSYLVQLGLSRISRSNWVRERWGRVHMRNARRLYRGMVRLRGVFIKLGQVLSIMGTFLPKAYVTELEGLQDEVPPQPYKKIARAIRRAFGKDVDALFHDFEREPIAAASLGQVHKARTHAGEEVAVKVLYPEVGMIIGVDLRVLGWVVRRLRWFMPVGQISRVHEQVTDMLNRETDLVHEADCLERMAENFKDDPDVLFPDVHRSLSARTVLTMSFMEGAKINQLDALEAMGLDPEDVATQLIKVFYKQLFFDRFFHADPHPGNFFVQRGPEGQPRLVILDFGAASEITDNLVQGMLHILSGLMGRDDSRVLEGIELMGFMAEDGDRELLQATVRKYFTKLLQLNITDFSNLGADNLVRFVDPGVRRAELRKLMRSVQYPLGWFFVERACIILFGLVTQLAPTLNAVHVGFPYIMQFLAENKLPPVPFKSDEAEPDD